MNCKRLNHGLIYVKPKDIWRLDNLGLHCTHVIRSVYGCIRSAASYTVVHASIIDIHSRVEVGRGRQTWKRKACPHNASSESILHVWQSSKSLPTWPTFFGTLATPCTRSAVNETVYITRNLSRGVFSRPSLPLSLSRLKVAPEIQLRDSEERC